MTEGSAWSKEGYEISIQLRSAKTLLVEGRNDKQLMERVISEKKLNTRNILIDTGEMISGKDYSTLGNKAKLLRLWDNLEDEVKSSGRITLMIDREWDGLVSTDCPATLAENWNESTHVGSHYYQTLGHSTENYGFNRDFITEYCKHYGEGAYSVRFEEELCRFLPEIFTLSTLFSIEAKKRSVLNKCDGVFSIDQFVFADRMTLNDNLTAALSNRMIADAKEMVDSINALSVHKLNCDKVCFLMHGHIGHSFIWACIGSLLFKMGLDKKTCMDLAFGRRDERLRFYHGWLSKVDPHYRRPIDDVIASAS